MPERNFQNRTLFHGDNIDFLRGINSGTVNLIATDPPFNKGKDFHATPDSLASGASFQDRWSWRDDVHDEWIDAIREKEPKVWNIITAAKEVYGDDMAAFLCWLGIRLIEMHRVLADDGSIYLHIDHTAHAWVKCLLDAVFGRTNFQNEIVWKRTSAHNDAKRYGVITDSILYYTKSPTFTWNSYLRPLPESTVKRWYTNDDNDGLGPYNRASLSAPTKVYKPDTWHEITITKRMWNAPLKGKMAEIIERDYIPGYRSIKSTYDRLDALDAAGLIHWPQKAGGIPSLKQYTSMSDGLKPSNLFDDLPMMRDLPKEYTGYPTQKPLALYERIIKASSNPGDLVLDPFCGCATTPIASEFLGREWIGMDLWNGAISVLRERMSKYGQAVIDKRKPDDFPSEQLLGRVFIAPAVNLVDIPPVRTDLQK